MSIDLGNTPVGTPPTPTEQTQLRTSFGLGAADTVEFGALETSQFNFPNLTTPELNAVTDAVAGDVYFDSDRGQFVRFTGAASYDVITSRSFSTPDTSTPSSDATLQASKFFESGLVPATDVFSVTHSVVVFDNEAMDDSSGKTYIQSDGGVVGAGWVDASNVFGGIITAPVVTMGSQLRFDSNLLTAPKRTGFIVERLIVSDVTTHDLATLNLLAGSTYDIGIDVSIGDLTTGNLQFDVDYTGLYSSSNVVITCDDLVQGTRLGTLNIPLVEDDSYAFNASTRVGVNSPQLGFYTFRILVTPSSAGTFTLSARQSATQANGLMIGSVQAVTTLMTN
tara:strand:- start:1339 stop:2349 length:1011 start_codon:yes stop_codon:yes gene_type:complete